MERNAAKKMLAEADGEEPVLLPPSILDKITIDDLPQDVSVEVGVPKDGVIHIEWSGRLYRDGNTISGEADHTWTRKYWYAPIGLEQYLDLVRRAVEVRKKTHGDVELSQYDDDGAYVHLSFSVATKETNLRRAYDVVRKVCVELEEASERTSDEIGKHIAATAARVSGWGGESFDALVNAVEKVRTRTRRAGALRNYPADFSRASKGSQSPAVCVPRPRRLIFPS